MCFVLRRLYWPFNHAYRQLTFIITDLVSLSKLYLKSLKQNKTRKILDEIFRVVIISMYLTYSILFGVPSNNNDLFLRIPFKWKPNLRRTDAKTIQHWSPEFLGGSVAHRILPAIAKDSTSRSNVCF